MGCFASAERPPRQEEPFKPEAVAASKPSASNTTNGAFTAQDNKLYEGPAVPSGQHSPRTQPDALTIDVRQSPKHSSPRHAFPESLVFLDARYSARVSPDSSGIAGVRRSPRTADHGGSTHSTRHQSHSGVEPRPPSRLGTSEGLAGNERRPPSRRVTSEALSGEARRRGAGFDGSPTATGGARGDRRHRSQAQVSPDGTSGGGSGLGGGMFELRPLSAQVRSHEGLVLSPPHSGSNSRTHEGTRTYEGLRTQEGMAHSPRDGSRTQEGVARDGSRTQEGVAQSPRDGSRRQEGVRTQEGEAGSRDGLGVREGSRTQDGMGRREGSRSHADMVRVREGLGSREGSRTQQGTGAKQGNGLGSREGSRTQQGTGARQGSRNEEGSRDRQGNGLGSREGSRTQQGMVAREGSRNLEGSRTQEAYAQWMEARVPSNVSAASSSAGGRAQQPADGAAVTSVTSVTPRQGSRTAEPRPASRVRVPDQGSGLSVEPRQGSRVRALEGLGVEPRRLSSVRADGLGFDPHPPPSRSNTSDSPRAWRTGSGRSQHQPFAPPSGKVALPSQPARYALTHADDGWRYALIRALLPHADPAARRSLRACCRAGVAAADTAARRLEWDGRKADPTAAIALSGSGAAWPDVTAVSIRAYKGSLEGLSGLPPALATLQLHSCLKQPSGDVLAPIAALAPTLRHLEMRSNQLGADGVAALAAVLPSLAGLQRLHLRDNGTGAGVAQALGPALGGLRGLTQLELGGSGCACGVEGAQALEPSLRNLTKLQVLDFSHLDLNCCGAQALAPALATLSQLTQLHLAGNRLGSLPAGGEQQSTEALAALAAALAALPALQQLQLGSNNLGASGTAQILGVSGTAQGTGSSGTAHVTGPSGTRATGAAGIDQALGTGKCFPALRVLGLTGNRLGGHGESIASIVQHLPLLSQLDLSCNRLTAEDGLALGSGGASAAGAAQGGLMGQAEGQAGGQEGAASSSGLGAATSSQGGASSGTGAGASGLGLLERLDASGNVLGAAGAVALAAALGPGLRALRLDGNQIGKEGGPQLLPRMCHLTGLTELDLCFMSMGPEGAEPLARLLLHLPALQSLRLDRNQFTDHSAQVLAPALARLARLQQLSLSLNAWGAQGLHELVPALRSLKSLRELDLSGCGLGPEGAMQLVRMLRDLRDLRGLALASNQLGVAGGESLVHTLCHLSHMTRLDLENNQMGRAAMDLAWLVSKSVPELQELRLGGSHLDPADVKALTALGNERHIILSAW